MKLWHTKVTIPLFVFWARLRGIDENSSRRLTLLEAISSEPDWSPDGSEIVFSSNKSGNYDLWLIALDGDSSKQDRKSVV